MFDANAELAALEPPQIKIGERVFTGRLLSHPEHGRWFRRVTRWIKLEDTDEADAQGGAEIKAFLTDVFDEQAATEIMKLPQPVLQRALIDFFARIYLSGQPLTSELPGGTPPS